MEFWLHPSEHWNSGLIVINIGILIFSFYFNRWNFSPILTHIRILILSFETLDFWPYFCTHWHCFWPHPSKYCNSGLIFIPIEIVILSFGTLEIWPYFVTHWNFDLIVPNIGILAIFYKHWTSYLILPLQTEILALSFQTLEFFFIIYTHWVSDLILQNIRILAQFQLGLELWCYASKQWNSSPIFKDIGILILSF